VLAMDINEITNKEEKSLITNTIVRKLPNWFGIEESIVNYVKEVQDYLFYACFNHKEAIGFIALKQHNQYTVEIAIMAVLLEYHKQGIGKKLVDISEQRLRREKIQFLTVKTLDASRFDESYSKTRKFYQAVGFLPLEVFPTLWDKANPCLFLCKVINYD